MDKKISFKDSLKLWFRALGIVNKETGGAVWILTVRVLVTAVIPFVNIYFMSLLISELTCGRNLELIYGIILKMLLIDLMLGLLSAVFIRWENVKNEILGDQIIDLRVIASKTLEMEYARFDSEQTSDAISQIMQNSNWNGYGLIEAYKICERFLKSLIGIGSVILLTYSFFATKVNENSEYRFLNSFIVNLFIIMLLVLISFASSKCKVHATDLNLRAGGEDIRLGNRIFNYLLCRPMDDKKMNCDVRIYNMQEYILKKCTGAQMPFAVNGVLDKLTKNGLGRWNAIGDMISVAFTGVVYLVVCLKSLAGAYGIGEVSRYVAALSMLSTNLGELYGVAGSLKRNAYFLNELFTFIDSPDEMYRGSLTTEKRVDANYEIEFRNVSFKYPGAKEWALRNLSVKFRIGSKIAIVGENGSGKTTFIKLLCRLYDPTEGEILLNGINIKKYKYKEYMDIFSVVFQDFKLLALPLGMNVSCLKEYDEDRVNVALAQAGFDGRIASLKNGLDTFLYKDLSEEGVNLSGGEAQKVAIARALYQNSGFVILDEPTAALDPVAEAEIYERFKDMVKDKTAIYISHRLSSCKFCDEIMVFDNGKIVQTGSHEMLVNEIGKYHELWTAQAGYYA